MVALRAAVQGLATAVASGTDIDADELKAFISGEVDRARTALRDALQEGYELRLEPKGDNAPPAA